LIAKILRTINNTISIENQSFESQPTKAMKAQKWEAVHRAASHFWACRLAKIENLLEKLELL
jgi:hypothetical protein